MAAGCSAKPALPDYRYRLTVEVDTPEGLRTGSSVIQVASAVSSKYALEPGDVTTQVTGEAVAVDLPGGKVLFALLSKPGSAEGANTYAFDALIPKPWVGWEEYVRDVNALVERRDIGVLPRWLPHQPGSLAPKYPQTPGYPMLVTFGNLNDPTTVLAVDPDNLAASFGPGVKLRRITVQITDEPVTTGIENRFRWWARYANLQLDGHRLNDSTGMANNLNRLNFSRGK
ncbi:MAG: hypothetical protein JSR96_05040 [Proteobacteria bacterium]|nr:hypothetical protein [Pseudomonadota bacterium]